MHVWPLWCIIDRRSLCRHRPWITNLIKSSHKELVYACVLYINTIYNCIHVFFIFSTCMRPACCEYVTVALIFPSGDVGSTLHAAVSVLLERGADLHVNVETSDKTYLPVLITSIHANMSCMHWNQRYMLFLQARWGYKDQEMSPPSPHKVL